MQVIVQIIYSDPDISPELEEYRDSLEKIGATVFLVPTGEDITCVQKSQLIRLLAHYFPFIHDNDIIVTGKSLSEALIFASTNPQFDDRLFI